MIEKSIVVLSLILCLLLGLTLIICALILLVHIRYKFRLQQINLNSFRIVGDSLDEKSNTYFVVGLNESYSVSKIIWMSDKKFGEFIRKQKSALTLKQAEQLLSEMGEIEECQDI